MDKVKIGIIGGSGIYEIEGLECIQEIEMDTNFGRCSDNLIIGTLDNFRVAFLPRHGRGHMLLPSEINYRANICALKKLGVEQIISISAVGSLKEEFKPCDFVIPDQLYDRTKNRENTFFGQGIVAHISFADPYCPHLSDIVYNTVKDIGVSVHKGGVYVCIEGPQFSTRAESNFYRQCGFSIIGMTNIPEAKLAREAEICYAACALVTDYDVWKKDEEVNAGKVMDNLRLNSVNAEKFIRAVLPRLKRSDKCGCVNALAAAIVTDKNSIPQSAVKKLDFLLGKYM